MEMYCAVLLHLFFVQLEIMKHLVFLYFNKNMVFPEPRNVLYIYHLDGYRSPVSQVSFIGFLGKSLAVKTNDETRQEWKVLTGKK